MGAGNNLEGTILVELHGRACGLDAAGNLILNGAQTGDGAPSRGFVGLAGSGIPFNCLITESQGASSNIANITFQIQDVNGKAIAGVFNIDVFLSDSATGQGLTATTASGGVAALSGDGAILAAPTASKKFSAQTNASGLFGMAITDTAKTGFYPCAVLSNVGQTQVGPQLTTNSYHP